MIFAPSVLGQLMGLPLDPSLALVCDDYETAKMEMVRALGGWQLMLAMTLLVVRSVRGVNVQRRLLWTFAAAGAIHVAINLHTLTIGNISSFGWIPVLVAASFVVLCVLALVGLRGHEDAQDGAAL